MEKVNEIEKINRFANFAAKVKEERRIATVDKAKQLWQAGKEDNAVALLTQWGSLFDDTTAREYCQAKFGAGATKQPGTPKAVATKPKKPLNVEEVIAESKRTLAKLKSRVPHAVSTQAKSEASQKPKEEDPLQFFKDNADDTDACIAKMREMGL
jgi:hypothetical protein